MLVQPFSVQTILGDQIKSIDFNVKASARQQQHLQYVDAPEKSGTATSLMRRNIDDS